MKIQNHILFASRMEINPAHIPRYLIKANIIEPLKACSQDLTHSVIWNKERFFPSHEYIFALSTILVVKIWFLGLLRQRPPRREAGPVLHIGLIRGTPGVMSGLKGVLGADDLAFEVGCQGRVIGGEA